MRQSDCLSLVVNGHTHPCAQDLREVLCNVCIGKQMPHAPVSDLSQENHV